MTTNKLPPILKIATSEIKNGRLWLRYKQFSLVTELDLSVGLYATSIQKFKENGIIISAILETNDPINYIQGGKIMLLVE